MRRVLALPFTVLSWVFLGVGIVFVWAAFRSCDVAGWIGGAE